MSEYKVKYYHNGTKAVEKWYKNNKLHRDDGAALIEYFENGNKALEKYYYNDCLHRLDGPAKVTYTINGRVNREYFYIFYKPVKKMYFYKILYLLNRSMRRYHTRKKEELHIKLKIGKLNKIDGWYDICKKIIGYV